MVIIKMINFLIYFLPALSVVFFIDAGAFFQAQAFMVNNKRSARRYNYRDKIRCSLVLTAAVAGDLSFATGGIDYMSAAAGCAILALILYTIADAYNFDD